MGYIIVLVILIAIIVALMIYNVIVYKKIQNYNDIEQKITGLNVLQDFMNTIGDYTSVDEKIARINEILIEKYDIKYSTIVMFDGAEYVIKATNVKEQHWDALRSLHNQDIFKDSISTATPKYVTINGEGDRLPYQTMEFGRAKSAMFFPLYIDNVYIGYWIIESGEPHAFDNIDTTILEVVKDNIISVYKTIGYQNTVEKIARDDKFTGLKSAEYLYGIGKKIIDNYTTSTVCMFKITNLEKINDTYGRKTGDRVVARVGESIKDSISPEYVFVRYMGPKFVIVFSGVNIEEVTEFVSNIKKELEKMKIQEISAETKQAKEEKKRTATPKINMVLSTYYKGTALESLTKKLEEYLDSNDEQEEISQI